MYADLDRVDESGRTDDGRYLLVQTDHRHPAAVGTAVEESLLFALARTARARYADVLLRYVVPGALHPALARAVVATGAEAVAAGSPVDLSSVPRIAPADLADEAFAALGRRLMAARDLPADRTAITVVEREVAGTPSAERDRVAHHTAVVQLAAVVGEVVRTVRGGRWVDDTISGAVVPFLFRTSDDRHVNPVGKAQRFLVHGDAQSPRALLDLLEDDPDPASGPVLVTLKPSDFDAAHLTVHAPLAPDLVRTADDMPLVVYGRDRPHSFSLMPADTAADRAALHAEALRNLARVEVTVTPVRAPFPLWLVDGDHFAAEKILDEEFLRRMHHEADAPLLAAAVPERGTLVLADALRAADDVGALVAWVRDLYESEESGHRISPTVFGLSEGRIVAVLHLPGSSTGSTKVR